MKGDWDVGIIVDVFEYVDDVDEIILVLGDGDFDIFVNVFKVKGKIVMVYGVFVLMVESI